ncbi:MAG: PA14 domain-containing protein [Planctomycetota bacterium]|nr:PA14 domain-containing protein [Planctomycetota bacterium]
MSNEQAPERQLSLPDPLVRALTRYAQLTRRLLIWEAAGWTAGLFVAGVLAAALADRWLLLEDSTRRALAWGLYAASAGLGWALLRRALRKRTAAEIAADLERRAPDGDLAERLSTTVELAARGGQEGFSRALIERVADEAAERVGKLPVEALPDREPARAARLAAGVMLALAVLPCFVPGWRMPLQYARATLPWLNLPRASQTQLDVRPGEARVVEGQSLDVEALLEGKPAESANLETREPGGAWSKLRMDRDLLHDERFTFKLGPLHVPLEYRVSAGDGRSQAFGIQVLPRPEIAGLTLTVHYPEYAKLPSKTYERVSGDLEVLRGSRVELALLSTTPLEAAVLEFTDPRRLSMQVEGERAAVSFEVAKDTSYRVRLRSNDGVVNPDAPLFAIHARADQTPQVAVLKPQADDTVDASSVLALEARAEDDLGIERMRLVVRPEDQHLPVVLELHRPPEAGKVWMVSQPWDLAGLFLGDGEALTYHVEAEDANGSIGKSDQRRLRIDAARRRSDRQLLEKLDEAQRRVETSRKLLAGAEKDVKEMLLVFRPEDVEFQAAERLLLAESFVRAGRESAGAAEALAAGLPHAEPGSLTILLTALKGELSRFGESGLQPLRRAGQQAQASEGARVAAGLDVLQALLPESLQELNALHEALAAAHRYAGATQAEARATDVRETQQRITPLLVGAAGWTPQGAFVPGLLAEYHRGLILDALVRRTVEWELDLKDAPLPDLGSEGLSVRWSGQALAPKAGAYTYRVLADDGVRLYLGGQLVIDQWKDQYPTAYEAAVELKEGWHDLKLEFYNNKGGYTFKLERADPDGPPRPLPREFLRTHGTPQPVYQHGEVRAAMAQGASSTAVHDARVRLQTMLEVARALPPRLKQLALLAPKPDAEVAQWGTEWKLAVERQTSPLFNLPEVAPGAALPLLEWNRHAAVWVTHYGNVRQRWKQALDQWARQLADKTFDLATRLRRLEQGAKAAREANAQLVRAAQEPPAPKRDAAMARADATVRARAEDLRSQAKAIAHELRQAANDTRREIDERRALQALAQRAESLARGPAEDLERRLREAATPEALAQAQANQPNLDAHAAELERDAGQLAALAERVERSLALRDALNETSGDAQAAHAALDKPPSPAHANEQLRAAAELKDNGRNLRHAWRAAANQVQPQALQPAGQVAGKLRQNPAVKTLEDQAAAARDGQPQDPAQKQAQDQAREAAGAELDALAKEARDAAKLVNEDLGRLADQLNGAAPQNLREAANHSQQSGQQLAGLPRDDARAAQPKLDAAAQQAQHARDKAAHTAENLALDAEARRLKAPDALAKKQAEHLAMLSGALKHTLDEKLEPAAAALQNARRDPSNGAQMVPKEAPERAEAAAKELNELAQLAEGLASAHPQAQEDAKKKLDDLLAQQGEADRLAEALKQAAALERLAEALKGAPPEQVQDPNAPKPPDPAAANPGADAEQLAALRQELAKQMGRDPEQAKLTRQALAERLNALAGDLMQQADRDRQAAGHLDRAAGLEQQARAAVKELGAELNRELNAAGQEAGKLAQQAQGQPQAGALNQAKDALPKAGEAARGVAQEADRAGLGELAGKLDALAQDLQQPAGALAGALGNPEDELTRQAQALGRRAQEAAGREADLADDLRRAERALNQGRSGERAQHGSRAEMEAQVREALKGLDRSGALPGEAGEALSALKQAAAEGGEAGARNQPGQAEGAPQDPAAAAGRARASAQRMAGMAQQVERLARAVRGDAAPLPGSSEGAQASPTPAADALQALAQAQAAAGMGRQGEAQGFQQQAERALDRAAQAARGQATGLKVPGRAEAQMLAQARAKAAQGAAQGEGSQQGPSDQANQAPAEGQGQGAQGQPKEGESGDGRAPPLPPGLPIDHATWNRLPDNLRRDLLNAAGGRFPAEYEASIRRYFKRLASAQEGER